MTDLKNLYFQLKDCFQIESPVFRIGNQVVCHTFPFESELPVVSQKPGVNDSWRVRLLNQNNPENRSFRYGVFLPDSKPMHARPIILLHGLNERSWDKYLPWAYTLAVQTSRPVILFPLANHMNRSPGDWQQPREMTRLVHRREENHGKIGNSSFANAALSYRMDESPVLFINSGMQTLFDLLKLTRQIYAGSHPLFSAKTGVDFFSYSIGAFVTEILLLANPLRLFSDSKAFLFCGGATFDQMDGRSKSILDDRAFSTLRAFIRRTAAPPDPGGADHSSMDAFWDAFLQMVSLERFNRYRDRILANIGRKIKAVGLKIDKVIPGNAIYQTLGSGPYNRQVQIADFNFAHSHETPFPISGNVNQADVEKAFHYVFSQAAQFLGSQRAM